MQNKSVHKLLEIIDSSSVGSFICDMEKGEIYYSYEWSKRLGVEHLSPREATLVATTYVHPEDQDDIQRAFSQACEQKSPKVRMEFRVKTVDSGYIWVLGQGKIIYDQDGRPVKYYGTHSDITERKKTEEKLQRYTEELKKKEEESLQLIDSFTEGTWIVDRLEGTIKCSEKWEKRIGLDLVPEEERLAYTITLPNSDDTVGGNSIQHQMKIGAERFDLEYRMKTVDRGYIWTQNRGKIVYNEHGEAIKVYAATLDITERKQMEEELRESERIALDLVEKLRIADKNKNAFINMLSHELRNPLASIMMSLCLMERISSGEKREARALEIAKRQGIQLTNLVDDLLDITRITQNKIILKKDTVEINNLIDMAVQDYRSQFIDKNVKLEVQLTTPLYIEADPSRITQVVGNLLHNAAKFTNSNDLVTVTVSHEIKSNQVLITVHDTGRGIAPEFLGNIFEPFIQVDKSLDRSLGGLGLGLAIVKGMVELHNGKVQVFSEGIGKGAKFTIWLPLSEEQMMKLN